MKTALYTGARVAEVFDVIEGEAWTATEAQSSEIVAASIYAVAGTRALADALNEIIACVAN